MAKQVQCFVWAAAIVLHHPPPGADTGQGHRVYKLDRMTVQGHKG